MFRVYKHHPDAKLPVKAHPTDIGYDLFACEDTFLPVDTTTMVDIGLTLEVPEGWWAQVLDRSSMGAKGIHTLAGVIDANYTGRLKVILHNLSNTSHQLENLSGKWRVFGTWGYWIKKGDRIAQIVYHKVENVGLYEVKSMWESKGRGDKGTGSSGV
jgi:dUTP pyrophosphatase